MPDRNQWRPARAKRRRRALRLGTAAAAICALVASGGAAAAEPIPLTPLAGVTSLDATVTLQVDGTVDGESTQGDLTAQLTSHEGASRIDVTGSLLGEVVAQVGGSAVKLFRPGKVSVYVVPEGTYVVLDALVDVCVKPEDAQATRALDQLSPQVLMDSLTGGDVARGTFVGDEMLGETAVKRYAIDGDEFMAAAQASSDPNVQLFVQSLQSATDADLYVATDGGYPVAYRGGFGGVFEPLRFEGDLDVAIDLTSINSGSEVTLPGSCDRAISV